MSETNQEIQELLQHCNSLLEQLESNDVDELKEARIRKKVVRGKKLKVKFKCRTAGMENKGGTCVRKSAKRKITLKKAKRKELRSKRQKGAGALRRANIKRKKSNAKRKSFGLNAKK